jgi:hypothetical protein
VLNKKKIIDLNYADTFDYKFVIIKNVNVFKGYMNTTHIHKAGLMFAIYYSRSQWNREIICQLLFLI